MRTFAVCLLMFTVVACSAESSGSPASPSQVPPSSTSPTPTTAGALTKATFAAEVNQAIQSKQTFRVRTATLDAKVTPLAADIHLVGEYTNMRLATGRTKLIKFSHNYNHYLYAEAPKLTGNPAKPWVKLDPDSDNIGVLVLAELSDELVSFATPYLLANGAPSATTFTAGAKEGIDGVDTTAYRMVIDLKQATAVNAFDDYLDAKDAKTLPRTLDVTMWIDGENLPRRSSFTFKGHKVVTMFDKFGQTPPVTPPPAGRIGTAKADL